MLVKREFACIYVKAEIFILNKEKSNNMKKSIDFNAMCINL